MNCLYIIKTVLYRVGCTVLKPVECNRNVKSLSLTYPDRSVIRSVIVTVPNTGTEVPRISPPWKIKSAITQTLKKNFFSTHNLLSFFITPLTVSICLKTFFLNILDPPQFPPLTPFNVDPEPMAVTPLGSSIDDCDYTCESRGQPLSLTQVSRQGWGGPY